MLPGTVPALYLVRYLVPYRERCLIAPGRYRIHVMLQVSKLKKDLKRTKALLRDAQTMLEKTQNEGTNKVILRQLKNQVSLQEYIPRYVPLL